MELGSKIVNTVNKMLILISLSQAWETPADN